MVSGRACLFVAVSLLLPAQDNATFSSDVRVVNVFATVRDHKGKIVPDLNKDDFALAEDGRPQTIRYFSRESNLPLTLGLLVDTSMSQRHVLPQEKAASRTFLQDMLRQDKDRAFLIHFDREVELLQDLTSSREKLEAALRSLDEPEQKEGPWLAGGSPRHGRYGGTALYDSVLLASDELMRNVKGRKALIILSDGVDNGSKMTMDDAIRSAQRADTLVYSILFSDRDFYGGRGGRGYGGHGYGHGGGGGRGRWGESRPDGKEVLERISRQTGGGFFEVTNKQPVEKIYAQIAEELRNQYSLGYVSDQTTVGPGYRTIRLTTRDTKLAVQAREGYYATSEPALTRQAQ